jgi:GMP synthase-like glutamine amidotransferase
MTKALIVDNDSDTLQELIRTAEAAGFKTTVIHCRQLAIDSAVGHDIIILSGGWWYDDEIQHLEVYKAELELIRHSMVPVLGICIGMQLMQIAYSGQVQLLDKPQRDVQTIELTPAGQELLGWPRTVQVHKNHTMGALSVAPGFEVLGNSPGHIEIIRHASRPLLGVQFHPEIGELAHCAEMLQQLVTAATRLSDPWAAGVEKTDNPQYLNQGLLIQPRPALDEPWVGRLFKASKNAAEIWAFLGPKRIELDRAFSGFNEDDALTFPSLRPDGSMVATLEAEQHQLQVLRHDVIDHEVDDRIRTAYLQRIDELLTNIDLYMTAWRADRQGFKRANQQLYGTPDEAVYAAVCSYLKSQASAWLKATPALQSTYDRLMAWLPDGGSADMLQPEEANFKHQRQAHMGNNGYYSQLFHGLPLPSGLVRPVIGDALIRQLLTNLGAHGYKIANSSDSYWGLRAGLATIVRPRSYALHAEEFIGTVGHEIGSHLLERLNGDRQPLRLLSSGLAGYEKGNEGRALLREQVAYETWAAFADQKRWYEILRRHLAISLASGISGRSLSFGNVFQRLHDLDRLWIGAHDTDNKIDDVRAYTWELVTRVLKGTDGTGGAYYKDIVYLEGNIACWHAALESPDIIRFGDLGKIDVTNAAHIALLSAML